MDRADICIRRILRHEGGFVDHPNDPGGATNLGVTIGTLKRLGIDVDGDGDSDIADLRKLRIEDAVLVYRRFYWDKVEGDLLPIGLDYAVVDYAVNSGVSRAAKALQGVVGASRDGVIGPKTIAAARAAGVFATIETLCDQRMGFLRSLRTWGTFGRGWTRRVNEVRNTALNDANGRPPVAPDVEPPETPQRASGWLVRLVQAVIGMLRGK